MEYEFEGFENSGLRLKHEFPIIEEWVCTHINEIHSKQDE